MVSVIMPAAAMGDHSNHAFDTFKQSLTQRDGDTAIRYIDAGIMATQLTGADEAKIYGGRRRS